MKNPRGIGATALVFGVRLLTARWARSKVAGYGELSDAVELGFSPENALPIAGQGGFVDSSGVDCFEELRSLADLRSRSNSHVS